MESLVRAPRMAVEVMPQTKSGQGISVSEKLGRAPEPQSQEEAESAPPLLESETSVEKSSGPEALPVVLPETRGAAHLIRWLQRTLSRAWGIPMRKEYREDRELDSEDSTEASATFVMRLQLAVYYTTQVLLGGIVRSLLVTYEKMLGRTRDPDDR